MQPSQLVDQRRIFRGLRSPPFDDNIPTLDRAEVTQRLGGERRGKEAACQGANEGAPGDHSITSSARLKTDDGIVRPMALAVLRLMMKSSRSSCSTGRSPGAAPCSTR